MGGIKVQVLRKDLAQRAPADHRPAAMEGEAETGEAFPLSRREDFMKKFDPGRVCLQRDSVYVDGSHGPKRLDYA